MNQQETPENQLEYEKTEAARDIAVEKSKQHCYAELLDTEGSPFYNMREPDLFMLAVGYGREKAGRTELQGDKHYLTQRFQLTNEQEWIIKSVAIKEEQSVDVLRDERLVYRIAQEYANAGIKKLHSRVFGPDDDSLSELTTEIVTLHNDN